MKKVILAKTNPLFLREEHVQQIPMDETDYLFRLGLLRERMRARGIDTVVLYGDREHFANIEYLTGYDCRFEEGMLIVPLTGTPTVLVGNEGMSYSYAIPYEIQRVYYRNFSLQGQPRRVQERLDTILRDAGIGAESRVGVIGYKYFYKEYCLTEPETTYDLPNYIMQTLFSVVAPERVCNCTDMLTGLTDGIRLRVYNAKEIASAEAAAARSANVLIRMLKGLEPGITEYALSERVGVGFAPVCMFSLVNFGARSVYLGLKSPRDDVALVPGTVCGLCYGVRGALSSRVGVAAYDESSMSEELKPSLFDFYGKFFEAMCRWYASVRVGADGNQLHHAVHDLIGAPEYGVSLNCGHFTGMDEWTNALTFDGSTYTIPDGAYMQADIIASNPDPVRTAICEDPLIVAGAELRTALREEYPQVYARIQARRAAMQSTLGMKLSEDVLPLSNLNAAMFPFMLNLDCVFAMREEGNV